MLIRLPTGQNFVDGKIVDQFVSINPQFVAEIWTNPKFPGSCVVVMKGGGEHMISRTESDVFAVINAACAHPGEVVGLGHKGEKHYGVS